MLQNKSSRSKDSFGNTAYKATIQSPPELFKEEAVTRRFGRQNEFSRSPNRLDELRTLSRVVPLDTVQGLPALNYGIEICL